MKDECFAALEKYRAGMSTTLIAEMYHVTPITVRSWIKAAVHAEGEKNAERRKATRAKVRLENEKKCAHCEWKNGTGVCVLPKCMARGGV